METDLLQYAAQLNEGGASCLASGNHCAAFEYFRNTLELLLLYNAHGSVILASSPFLHAAALSLLSEPIAYHNILLSERVSNADNCSIVNSQQQEQQQQQLTSHNKVSTNRHLFTKAFVFQPKEDLTRDDHVRVRTYIAILFFNMATTIHQTRAYSGDDEDDNGANCSNGDELALQVALQLYNVGFDLLIQEESSCMDDWATNINLAALNNMSQCHYALSDFAKASRILDLQKSLLQIIFTNKRPHNFSEQEMELFVLNTHLLKTPTAASAA